MVRYRIVFTPAAERAFFALSKEVLRRIDQRILSLQDNPRPTGIKVPKGDTGIYRLRVGDYRILYKVHDDQVVVVIVAIGHRREIYRGK
jgi:mRNA interferase RelE/StbE